jgi:hypothetical protein
MGHVNSAFTLQLTWNITIWVRIDGWRICVTVKKKSVLKSNCRSLVSIFTNSSIDHAWQRQRCQQIRGYSLDDFEASIGLHRQRNIIINQDNAVLRRALIPRKASLQPPPTSAAA